MGYSCTIIASLTLDACMMIVGEEKSSNTIRGGRFYERGRENPDGAITCQVMKILPDGIHCVNSGSIRIEGNGKITRFPTMSKAEREQAEKTAAAMFDQKYTSGIPRL